MFLNGIRRFCMTMTDSVPGVSGGTITFLLGLYDEFINSPDDLMGEDNVRRKQAFIFLSKLDIGWILGSCLSVLVLSGLFQDYIYKISFVFMGLTLFTILMVVKGERHSMKGRYGNLIFTFVRMILVSCTSYFNPTDEQGINVSVKHLSLGLVIYVFIITMVVTAVTVLPGISGSMPLLIFGIYIPVAGTVKEFLHMNLNHVPILAVFGLGVITGIVGVIELVKLRLRRYRSQAIYAIIGLTVGSLYAIAMGPTAPDMPRDPMGLDMLRILFFLLGGLILVRLESMKTRLEKQQRRTYGENRPSDAQGGNALSGPQYLAGEETRHQ